MCIPFDEREDAKFSDLIGVILTTVEGLERGSECIVFKAADGREFVMFHDQECCESVAVEDVTGDVSDLVDTPILIAEESSSDSPPDDFQQREEPESQTWTFYKLATVKGYIDIRWFGTSNGYYSEKAEFMRRKRQAISD